MSATAPEEAELPQEDAPTAEGGESSGAELPDDLPPVEPPSAGFILQLFLVPGLIVAAVIGVWALFGKMSSSEQDWRQQIVEMRSNNEHRRWRGANGLAQMLRADIELGKDGQKLSKNPAIAKELTELFSDLLAETGRDEELISQQSFLARTLAWLDTHEVVIPILLEAADPKRDDIVRSDAIRSLAIIAGRADEAGNRLSDSALADSLIEFSQDSNPLTRQLCAYTLGLIDGGGVEQRLTVMTEDSDDNTQINAAIALARTGSTKGLPVFVRVLKEAPKPVDPRTMDGENDEERQAQAENQEAMNAIALVNVLKALQDVYPNLEATESDQVRSLVEPIADAFEIIKIRIRAQETLRTFDESQSESAKN